MFQTKTTLLVGILFFCASLFAQNNNVGINTSTPDPSAILHLESTDQGLLVTRLTTVQRDAITAPATGLIIYNTDGNQVEIYNGTCWIPSYLKTCDDCDVQFTIAQTSYTIDRVNNMSVSIPVTITQTTPNGQTLPVDLGLSHTFSTETTVALSQYSYAGGTTTVNVDIQTTVFENGGTHHITLFGICGDRTVTKTIAIDIQACDLVTITTDQVNYNLAANGITGTNCVVVTIEDDVAIRSANAANPAFTTGNINTNCNLGIINRGYIFGKGGNGPQLMGQNGENGGTALELNCSAEIRNKGMIYGGGGSGLTVGAFESINLGVATLCLAIGAGGGGGMPDGIGGGGAQGSCSLMLGVWADGNDAGPNYDDNEGEAVSENISQSFSFGPVQGNISITAHGGGGGDFGENGTGSSQPVDFGGSSLEICLNLPFIGNVCAPVPGFSSALNAIANAINNAFNTSVPGLGGYAVKHTTPCSLPDGNYQTYQVRGKIGN